jgi:valyl-tRNA synthetase
MKAVELDKTYNPKDFEDRLYKFWEENGYFKPAGDENKEPFTIVIPPPNVTGVLHVGHGLNNSIQYIQIR